MTTDEIIEKIKAVRWMELRDIAAATGIPQPTLHAIRSGRSKNPTGRTCDGLRAYFQSKVECPEGSNFNPQGNPLPDPADLGPSQ